MIATERKHIFMWRGKRHEVLKVIIGEYGDAIPVAVVIAVNGGRVFILNRDYPNLVDVETKEVNASFVRHLRRIQ